MIFEIANKENKEEVISVIIGGKQYRSGKLQIESIIKEAKKINGKRRRYKKI